MTRSERMQAFSMRLDGDSWERIGSAIGYAGDTVRRDLHNCMLAPSTFRCAYPALRKYITEHHAGSVREFARDCGISLSTMYRALRGDEEPSPFTTRVIAETTGLDIGHAFFREGRGDNVLL